MRVIAGTYGGRTISAPKGRSVRPTADRVREALFSMLGPMDGLRVLDLFAGSGALGIEALSRGAATATFVDSDAGAVRAIKANLDSLGIVCQEVFRSDATRFLEGARRHGSSWDLVFCDPPYRLAHRLGRDLEALLGPVMSERARIVVESSNKQPAQLAMPGVGQRRYGDTLISVHSRAGSDDAA